MKKGKVLIVDDNPHYRDLLAATLQNGYQVQKAGSGAEALSILSDHPIDLVLLDVEMQGSSSIETLQSIKSNWPETEIIMLTVLSKYDIIEESRRHGSHDHIVKGSSPGEILNRVDNLFKKIRSEKTIKYLSQDLQSNLEEEMFIGPSEASQRLKQELKIAASCDATCLITGETGVGKDLAAAFIHNESRGPDKPYVVVNLSNISEDKVESNLFGHERGAFPWAEESREGKFELAEGGTILLDEIGDLSLENQAKLLRVIETHEVERVGSNRKRVLDVRVLATASGDLMEKIQEGSFRDTLYYRLNVMSIRVPPLRERMEDIEPLAKRFLKIHSAKYRKIIAGFSEEVLATLKRQPWRGNIRELSHVIQRLVIYSQKETIEKSDLPMDLVMSSPSGMSNKVFVQNKDFVEKQMIQKALARNRFNKSKTARELGIPVETLRYRILKLGITKVSSGD